MKRIIALLLTIVLAVSLVACGGKDDSSKSDDSSEPAADSTTEDSTSEDSASEDSPVEDSTAADGSSIAVCLASEPDTIDPALNSAVDGGTMLVHLFSGLAKWDIDADGNVGVVADAAEELVEPEMQDDGTAVYTYTLRDGLKWTDGEDVTADDFVFAWNRAASFDLAADYNYMFDIVAGYADIW